MTRGSRQPAAAERQRRHCRQDHDRRLHEIFEQEDHRTSPLSRTRLSNAESRLYSASVSGSSVASISAAIAELGESWKNVLIKWRTADRPASSGFAVGKYTNLGPSYSRVKSPRSIMISSS